MKTSESALKKIAEFEGIHLKAYKCPAGVWTIGVGHTNGVTEGMTITQAQAMDFFENDIRKYEDYVTATGIALNQNQFDALVSFSFNCGVGNLRKLVNGRDYQQIAEAIMKYNKARVKGVMTVLPGLTRRREWERNLFLSGAGVTPKTEKQRIIKTGSRGDDVKEIQEALNRHGYCLAVDGIVGQRTEAAIVHFQRRMGLVPDGIVGPKTRAALHA